MDNDEINAAVAKRLGWYKVEIRPDYPQKVWGQFDLTAPMIPLPDFCGEISAAWGILQSWMMNGGDFSVSTAIGGFRAELRQGIEIKAIQKDPNACKAICLSYLAAVPAESTSQPK